MTVCIAVRTQGMILIVSDRMITSADMEYEPEHTKILRLTNSVSMVFSGDASFYAEVVQDVIIEVDRRVAAAPDIWLTVREVANIWSRAFTEARMRHAEVTVLAPYGLNRKSFVEKLGTLDAALTDRLGQDMLKHSVPSVEVIIAGVDLRHGKSSPTIWQGFDEEVMCADTLAFVAIGNGARHAESQFMLASYGFMMPNGEALLLAYTAKRNAEVAPGVGKETDIIAIGPEMGQTSELPAALAARLEEEYKRVVEAEENARKKGREAVNLFIGEIAKKNAEDQQVALPQSDKS
jgi:hypothetical protein